MRTIEAGAQTARKRGYATNSSLAGINLIARKRWKGERGPMRAG